MINIFVYICKYEVQDQIERKTEDSSKSKINLRFNHIWKSKQNKKIQEKNKSIEYPSDIKDPCQRRINDQNL